MLRMGDGIVVGNLPSDLDAYAGYVGGHWPDYQSVVVRFPQAKHLSIAINAGQRADCLDVEAGDAAPSDVPGWLALWKPINTSKPVIYCNASTIASIPGPRSAYLLWSAHYTSQHVCAPGVCGYPQADGTQWTTHNNVWDESLLSDTFFSAAPPPGPTPPPTPPPTPTRKEIVRMFVAVASDGPIKGDVYQISEGANGPVKTGLISGADQQNLLLCFGQAGPVPLSSALLNRYPGQ